MSVPPSFPGVCPEVFETLRGVPYLLGPGAVLLSRPDVDLGGMRKFLADFKLGFEDYANDPDPLPPAETLIKAAGQLCYMSLGAARTKNAQAKDYLTNIKKQGHGSVLEHANFSFLLYGIDRSVTHELVRHRAGWAFSQVSQRYVSGKTLRFVERREYQGDLSLHDAFVARIEAAAEEYAHLTKRLMTLQGSGETLLSGESRTDLRKKVQQAARSCLPNEAEAPIVVTANVRAWRHFLEMRASRFSDTAIRGAAVCVGQILCKAAPLCFDDYTLVSLPDGTHAYDTDFRKV